MSPASLLLICREGYEAALAQEAATRLGGGMRPQARAGHVLVPGMEAVPQGPASPFIFEHQRLPQAALVAAGAPHTPGLPATAAAAAADAMQALPPGAPWVLHAMAAPDAPAKLLPPLQAALREALPTALAAREQAADAAPADAWVLQWLLTRQGIWQALCPLARLSSPWPGGAHHARRDDAAPSRSTLKLEEALALMDDPPRPRARAIDLGAAPGGWSYALLKRGCRVLAVDNGPLTIAGLDELPGELEHLRADGMAFKPPTAWLPADWWVSDMLVPPGKALGLLRRWLGQGWCRRFVVNFKLPQANPLPALAPVQDYLASLPGARWHLRHLYHDRQEVTLFGWLDLRRNAAQPAAAGRKAAHPRREHHPPGKRPSAKAGRPAPRPSRRGRGKGNRPQGGRP